MEKPTLLEQIKEALMALRHRTIEAPGEGLSPSPAAERFGARFEDAGSKVDYAARQHTSKLPVPPHIAEALGIDKPHRPMLGFEREPKDEGEL